MERLIDEQLRAHLADNHLKAFQQHGFIPNLLTTTNLLQCEYIIKQYLNLKQSSNLIK